MRLQAIAEGKPTWLVTSLPGKDYRKEGSIRFKDEPPVRCRLILIELENGEKEVLCSSLVDSTIFCVVGVYVSLTAYNFIDCFIEISYFHCSRLIFPQLWND
jgi:hypothetical protein